MTTLLSLYYISYISIHLWVHNELGQSDSSLKTATEETETVSREINTCLSIVCIIKLHPNRATYKKELYACTEFFTDRTTHPSSQS